MAHLPVVELSKRFQFSACHRLHNAKWSDEQNKQVFGKCNNLNGHGHNYVVTVCFKGPVDDKSGMVVNLTDVGVVLKKIEAVVDHKNLDKDVEWFVSSGKVSTTENLAVMVWEMVQDTELRDLLHKVVINETENNKFVYKGEKAKPMPK